MSLFDEDFNQAQPLVILVDDDHNILSALQRALRNIDAMLMTFTSAYEALEYCQSNQAQLVISDQHMPEMEGCEFLQRVKNKWPGSQRIILSGYQDFQKYLARSITASCNALSANLGITKNLILLLIKR
jgi:two-component system repressor protein LuxO